MIRAPPSENPRYQTCNEFISSDYKYWFHQCWLFKQRQVFAHNPAMEPSAVAFHQKLKNCFWWTDHKETGWLSHQKEPSLTKISTPGQLNSGDATDWNNGMQIGWFGWNQQFSGWFRATFPLWDFLVTYQFYTTFCLMNRITICFPKKSSGI